ncbi:hypothetical protein [Nonomuraea jabiensis]|uniref:Uncharacterized protein n=1 Tax=Nonomuraea jabiensis TaxID=882448 RepID=A0A7W9LB74_9ACTN|nr:hypothetical protein [Nonomuraea jabiensis]MBB5777193.1 hypothetical protein [Nonomuraea jabiensis]
MTQSQVVLLPAAPGRQVLEARASARSGRPTRASTPTSWNCRMGRAITDVQRVTDAPTPSSQRAEWDRVANSPPTRSAGPGSSARRCRPPTMNCTTATTPSTAAAPSRRSTVVSAEKERSTVLRATPQENAAQISQVAVSCGGTSRIPGARRIGPRRRPNAISPARTPSSQPISAE